MANDNRECILHFGGPTKGDILPFNDDKWLRVKVAHERRQTLFFSSMFNKIKLPDNYDNTLGYHVICYKNFTAVPRSKSEPPPGEHKKPLL